MSAMGRKQTNVVNGWKAAIALRQGPSQCPKMKIRPLATALSIVGTYAVLAIGVTAFGRPLARNHAGVLDAFSFQEGPFSWSYSFDGGAVGPFVIGGPREEAIQSAIACNCFWAYPLVPQKPRVRLADVPQQALSSYFPRDGEALLSDGAAQYILIFANGRLERVTRSRFVFAGL
jgi:hypothetical protein